MPGIITLEEAREISLKLSPSEQDLKQYVGYFVPGMTSVIPNDIKSHLRNTVASCSFLVSARSKNLQLQFDEADLIGGPGRLEFRLDFGRKILHHLKYTPKF